jgi:3-carboxy-cis,cis-muconate cycloisomerase
VSGRLIDALATTAPLADIFGDGSLLQAMVDFEVALARAQAEAGIIPRSAADAIVKAARGGAFDAEGLARGARKSATVAIPFVSALTDLIRGIDPESAAFVHFGATSQDVADSAIALLLGRARIVLAADQARLAAALRRLSDAHSTTIMLGRTVMQPAAPITFGLKAAHWFSAVTAAWVRVDSAFAAAGTVQFGGATGTLASFGDGGLELGRAVARELGLQPSLPWHTDRGRLAALVGACGVFTGALGKIARDITLLVQPEVGELTAPGGGSSSMPHKQNPAGCAIALAAATRVPGIAAGFLAGLVQEHERAAGGWQAEWPAMAAAVEATGAALAAIADTMDGIRVHEDRMRANIEATGGAIFAERATLLLRAAAGRDRAEAIVSRALARIKPGGPTFASALRTDPEAAGLLSAAQLASLERPQDYLGAADTIRRRLLDNTESR